MGEGTNNLWQEKFYKFQTYLVLSNSIRLEESLNKRGKYDMGLVGLSRMLIIAHVHTVFCAFKGVKILFRQKLFP